MNVKTTNDLLLELIPLFQSMYETNTKPKNDSFIKKIILQLQKYPNLIEPQKAVSKAKEKEPEAPDPMIEILKLSKSMTK